MRKSFLVGILVLSGIIIPVFANIGIQPVYQPPMVPTPNTSGGYVMAVWSQTEVKPAIGVIMTDVFSGIEGKAVLMNTLPFSQVRMQAVWEKTGVGDHSVRVISGSDVLIEMELADGLNESGWQSIPTSLINTEKSYRLQVNSTVALDSAVFENAVIWMR